MRIDLSTGTEAEIAHPAGPPKRGLVLLPDIMGLRPLFDDHVARLSNENDWTVCAPEPFPGLTDLTLEERHEVIASFTDEAKRADALAAAEATGCERVGVIGFCMGGMYALKCAKSDRFDRIVSFYGMIRMPGMWRSDTQTDAIDAVLSRDASTVMAHIGAVDDWTPAAQVSELAASGAVVHIYPEADHGFVHDPQRATHIPDAAELAWSRTIDFLRT